MEAGCAPMYYDKQRPWALVFTQSVEDRNYWEDHVEKPINDAATFDGAAALATLQHSDYQPPVNGDIYADITGRPRGAGGPYDPRPAPWHTGAPSGRRPQTVKQPAASGHALALQLQSQAVTCCPTDGINHMVGRVSAGFGAVSIRQDIRLQR